ncbi:cytosine-specific methyltransferase [Prescottella equi]|nr:cytosine-specific methyltransferase [Prescottella equi]
MEIVAGIDFDHYSAKTFQLNFPKASFIERDIREVSVSAVSDLLTVGRPVLFSGCAPCQPFSRQNRTSGKDDPRRDLLGHFEEFVLGLTPDYVLVENVPGAQNFKHGGPFLQFIANLEEVGYNVSSGVLRAGDFGVAQERKRFVIMAALSKSVQLPEPQESTAPATVRSTIAHLPALVAGGVDPHDPDHAAMNLSDKNLERIRATPAEGTRKSWPEHLRLQCHGEHSGHSDVYGRMKWDSVASGLTTRCLSYSNGRFGHPTQDRAISLREAALLQSFPASFRFFGPLGERGKQVGNAVPPLMAKAIGEAFCA